MNHIILFDLDGTLTDPKEGITKSVQHALQAYGIDEPDLDKLCPFIGPPLSDSFKEYYGFSEAQAREAIGHFHEYFTKQGMFENKVYPGITHLLKKCRDCGVITSRISIPKVSNVSLLQTVFTYDGKAKTPKVTVKDSTGQVLPLGSTYMLSYPKNRKDVNQYAVSLTLTGGRYAGTKQLYFTVKPQATAFSKVKAGKKKMTLKWKKKSQISGYFRTMRNTAYRMHQDV